MERSEIVKQGIKLGVVVLTVMALSYVIIVSQDIQHMVLCILQQRPVDKIVTAPPPQPKSTPSSQQFPVLHPTTPPFPLGPVPIRAENCSSWSSTHDLHLKVDICPPNGVLHGNYPTISIAVDNNVARVYSLNSTKIFVDILRRCTNTELFKSCQLFNHGSRGCHIMASISHPEDYLCYTTTKRLTFDHIVINNLPFSNSESNAFIAYILDSPLIKPL